VSTAATALLNAPIWLPCWPGASGAPISSPLLFKMPPSVK